MGKWIWVNPKSAEGDSVYFAEFLKEYKFGKEIREVKIHATGDTFFKLYCNGALIGRGPHCAGGDHDGTSQFNQAAKTRQIYPKVLACTYVSEFVVPVQGSTLSFFAWVRFSRLVATDTSAGRGGFFLDAEVTFHDGSTRTVGTDRTWFGRIASQNRSTALTDYTNPEQSFEAVTEIGNVWNTKPTQIDNLVESELVPPDFSPILVAPFEQKEICVDFDRIYSGYVFLEIAAKNTCRIEIKTYEEKHIIRNVLEVVTDKNTAYESVTMAAVGGFYLSVRNLGSDSVIIEKAGLNFVRYPVKQEGRFFCSDEDLNQIYTAGKHALQICRQSIHLDSPTHQENLGCTGDYYIESLVEYFAYGDVKLTRFDIIRTAHLLRDGQGRMFHTTYSLIYLQMLWDYYMFSGDAGIFPLVEPALSLLFERFETYEKDDVIAAPPDYMFVDWLEVDGFSLHHPPKALGQTVLNAFYYKALLTGTDIYALLGEQAKEAHLREKARRLKEAFHRHFYDDAKKLYTNGSTEPTEEHLVGQCQPQNTNKQYFSVHANALAVLYGLCPSEKARETMEHILNDNSLIYPQPYFMHFVMEAVWEAGLFEKYGLATLRLWKKAISWEKLALKEGWIEVGSYGFDLSHAWASTPSYQLPSRLLGFQMIEPGFKKIQLSPCLYGLDFAEISVPTPYGFICCKMEKDQKPLLEIPAGIEWEVALP